MDGGVIRHTVRNGIQWNLCNANILLNEKNVMAVSTFQGKFELVEWGELVVVMFKCVRIIVCPLSVPL